MSSLVLAVESERLLCEPRLFAFRKLIDDYKFGLTIASGTDMPLCTFSRYFESLQM